MRVQDEFQWLITIMLVLYALKIQIPAPPMKKTPEEIQAEIAALEAIKPDVTKFTLFGDDNHKCIDAQVEVLKNGTSDGDVWDAFDNACEDDLFFKEVTVDSAFLAIRWREGESGEQPSALWAEGVKRRGGKA